MKLVLISILIGSLKVTAYRSVPEQTDSSPYITSIGERVNNHGVAVSQDLLKKNGGPIDYGDLLYIHGVGFKVVNDCMAKRHRNSIVIWVSSKAEEQRIFKIFRNGSIEVWLIHSKLEAK